MARLFRVLVAGLTLTIVGFTAFVMLDGNGTAKADSPIECSSVTDENTDPDTVTLTCGGSFSYSTPVGAQTFSFQVVIVFADNPPAGPSFGDEILSCALSVNGGPPDPIHLGPCP